MLVTRVSFSKVTPLLEAGGHLRAGSYMRSAYHALLALAGHDTRAYRLPAWSRLYVEARPGNINLTLYNGLNFNLPLK